MLRNYRNKPALRNRPSTKGVNPWTAQQEEQRAALCLPSPLLLVPLAGALRVAVAKKYLKFVLLSASPQISNSSRVAGKNMGLRVTLIFPISNNF